MSATRDKSQKISFVYQNLYQIYRKGTERARASDASVHSALFAAPSSRNVLKADDLRSGASAPAPRVESFAPAELIGKRLAKPEALKEALAAQPKRDAASKEAIQSLRQNLKQLNDLHSRLRFMLQELEELSKE